MTTPYGIAALATLAGVSQDVIRVWERRYRALSPERTDSGRRRYGEVDLERLKLLVSLVSQGHPIGAIASLPTAELAHLASKNSAVALGVDRVARSTQTALLEAFERFDAEEASRLLGRAVLAFDLVTLLSSVITPLLEEIGVRWQKKQFSVSQEHAASHLIHAHLLDLLRGLPQPSRAPVTVAGTPAGEQHGLGSLFAALLAAQAGQRVVFLGGSLPAEDIALAVERSGASRLLLSIVALRPSDAERELRQIAQLVPAHVDLVVGGRGATQLVLPKGFRLAGLSSLVSV